MNLTDLLGLHPDDASFTQHISALTSAAARDAPVAPEIKSYSDAVYFNYFALGLSVLFSPTDGYKPSAGAKSTDLKTDKLVLDSIYIYNVPTQAGSRKRAAELAFTTYPISPIALVIKPKNDDAEGDAPSRPPQLDVGLDTAGKQFVAALGEPDRKGGGAGPSSGSIGIWCEWSKDGIMVEFGGDEAQGPQAWERGKDAIWKIITLFSPAQ
ncbi:hypothetical protein HYPSUDRAFT_32697 [Hypholoma sublateritium FD-334 SS-4]|uniref:Uncharacterized protein n=1 Tax=Hypholoma sublateritium (strain FD-334 SS-4) TaxID=945553 RepID=A0A0D2QCE5_HYPSF|nr:hypothetical protein HYPSUDRAFT_32697 [Hypholoma sublateritium FD-334 SS-4]